MAGDVGLGICRDKRFERGAIARKRFIAQCLRHGSVEPDDELRIDQMTAHALAFDASYQALVG